MALLRVTFGNSGHMWMYDDVTMQRLLTEAGFVDIGNVYGFSTDFDPTDLRKAAGGGIRWQSPFGPIRVDYGINLDRKAGEGFGALRMLRQRQLF